MMMMMMMAGANAAADFEAGMVLQGQIRVVTKKGISLQVLTCVLSA